MVTPSISGNSETQLSRLKTNTNHRFAKVRSNNANFSPVAHFESIIIPRFDNSNRSDFKCHPSAVRDAAAVNLLYPVSIVVELILGV